MKYIDINNVAEELVFTPRDSAINFFNFYSKLDNTVISLTPDSTLVDTDGKTKITFDASIFTLGYYDLYITEFNNLENSSIKYHTLIEVYDSTNDTREDINKDKYIVNGLSSEDNTDYITL